jgi:hypothetical protein
VSGYRRHPRYVISNLEGILRVVTDVMVQQDAQGNLIAISDQPRTCGEVLTIELIDGALVGTPVRVAEVRPIIDNGSIRHWLRLIPLENTGESGPASPVVDGR